MNISERLIDAVKGAKISLFLIGQSNEASKKS